MHEAHVSDLKELISSQHGGDEKQLEIIFSESPRLIVEAPAGYGKTTTMISRIAYLFASGRIPNPKRILGLTFSVNAALKVKREVAEKLPALFGTKNSPIAIGERVTVTNYHGFCKGVLKKYGYLVANEFRKDINTFKAIGDIRNSQGNVTNEWREIAKSLTTQEQDAVHTVDSTIKSGTLPSAEILTPYFAVIKKLLPNGNITHNAVVLFTLQLFEQNEEVKKFFQSYYPLIVVDEFQDTNCIAWALLKKIIGDDTQLVFLGDPLQRIYGFIGALPRIMETTKTELCMTEIKLTQNYRFRKNPEMLKLDKNIRLNAEFCFAPDIVDTDVANLPIFYGKDQQCEAQLVAATVQNITTQSDVKIAVLFRSKKSDSVETELSNLNISYFYGMFSDDDSEYVEFHIKCQEKFLIRFATTKSITKKSLLAFSETVRKEYTTTDKTIGSLFRLLDALIEKVSTDYVDLSAEDKYTLILEIFENRQLKQAMEYVDSNIILTTIHGAKGLEWDYVIITDMERSCLPAYPICIDCSNLRATFQSHKCSLPNPMDDRFKEIVLDELSVFYVGITRARQQAYISASAVNANGYSSIVSCLANIAGIKLVKADTMATS